MDWEKALSVLFIIGAVGSTIRLFCGGLSFVVYHKSLEYSIDKVAGVRKIFNPMRWWVACVIFWVLVIYL
jgi:hypothetical protein